MLSGLVLEGKKRDPLGSGHDNYFWQLMWKTVDPELLEDLYTSIDLNLQRCHASILDVFEITYMRGRHE